MLVFCKKCHRPELGASCDRRHRGALMPARSKAAIEAGPAADDADDQSDGDEPQEDLNSAVDMIEFRRCQKSIQDASNAVS